MEDDNHYGDVNTLGLSHHFIIADCLSHMHTVHMRYGVRGVINSTQLSTPSMPTLSVLLCVVKLTYAGKSLEFDLKDISTTFCSQQSLVSVNIGKSCLWQKPVI